MPVASSQTAPAFVVGVSFLNDLSYIAVKLGRSPHDKEKVKEPCRKAQVRGHS